MGLFTALWFILPAYAANGLAVVFHGKTPVDYGRVAWDGNRYIGDGVTWGGVIAGIITGVIVSSLQFVLFESYYPIEGATLIDAIALGFLLGLGAMLGDMSESFLKRRLGINRGQPLILLDQWDFLIGAILLSSLIVNIPYYDIFLLLIITPLVHLGSNIIGNKAGLKEVPW